MAGAELCKRAQREGERDLKVPGDKDHVRHLAEAYILNVGMISSLRRGARR